MSATRTGIGWGTRIAILYLSFVSLIVFMVSMSFRKKVDLVSPDYYREELEFQQHLNAAGNASAVGGNFTVKQSGALIRIQLPGFFAGKAVSGEIHFFRPSDSARDKKLRLEPDARASQEISTLPEKGFYKVKVHFSCKDRNYYYEEDLFIR